MPRYLVSLRAVFDIIKMNKSPAIEWYRRFESLKSPHDIVYISAIIPMQVNLIIDDEIHKNRLSVSPTPESILDLKKMRRNAGRLFDSLASDGNIVPMCYRVADVWGDLLFEKIEYHLRNSSKISIGAIEKIEIATAIMGVNGNLLHYVIEKQPDHDRISGLSIEDLSIIDSR